MARSNTKPLPVQHYGAQTEMRKQIDFNAIQQQSLACLPTLLQRWLPNGKRIGNEYVALNPTRADRHLGSFRINIVTGRWSDFATGDRGGDVVSLYAYLYGLRQSDAARRLQSELDDK